MNELKKLWDIYHQLARENNFENDIPFEIKISNCLRCSNGYFSYQGIRDIFTGKINPFASKMKIVMSRAVLEEFGWERMEKAFRHEVAHLANFVLSDGRSRGHNYNFKVLCKKFEGSMNGSHAKGQFSSCRETQFVTPIKKIKYICPCGKETTRNRRLSTKIRTSKNYVCTKCETPVSEWKEISLI